LGHCPNKGETRLQQDLGIEHGNEYTFWEFLWNVLGIDWLSKNLDQSAIEILRFIFSGQEYGMGYLINHAAALPNGLYHNYQCLVSPDKVRFIVDGILAKQEYFNQVATWQSFQQNCQPHHVVHKNVWQEVNKLHGNNTAQLTNLTFALALEWELDNKEINYIKARNLGEIVTSEFLRSTTIRSEYDRIKPILEGVCFQSENNRTYVLAAHLLVRLANNAEERLLAAFAPSNLLLHSDYIDSSLDFFLVCREQRETVAVEDMVAWAKAADSDEKRQAVREYLGLGERKLVFANALRNSIIGTWMEQDEGVAQILKVSSQQARVEQAIRGEITWDEVGNGFANESQEEEEENEPLRFTPPDDNKVRDILKKVYKEWSVRGDSWIREYEGSVYPHDKFPVSSEKDDDVQDNQKARENWLILLFLGATHTMGYFNDGSHRKFIELCQEKDWWKTFAKPSPQENSDEWIKIIDTYLKSTSDKMEYWHWMKNFVPIYQLSRYLKEYSIDIFCALNQQQKSLDSLDDILKTKSSDTFDSGGVSVPSLSKTLGMGAHFIIRELVRKEVICGDKVLQNIYPYCFVPTKKVRNIFSRLGCFKQDDIKKWDETHSKEIYKFLKSHLDLEYHSLLHRDFDLPFQYIDVNQYF